MAGATESDARDARDGSREAFARLYARVCPAIETWARVRLSVRSRSHVEPEDLVQEVWWRALKSFSRFRPGVSSFRAWIFKIASNTLLEMLRRRGSRFGSEVSQRGHALDELEPVLEAQLTSITESAKRSDSVHKLAATILELPAEEQRLFIHRGLEELPSADVAVIMGISENAVNKRWRRLRDRLAPLSVWQEFEAGAG